MQDECAPPGAHSNTGQICEPVTGEDRVVLVDQNRICESKRLDAVRDLFDLLSRMRPRVPRIWLQNGRFQY